MAGAIALVGGDEFRPGCESMDQAILEAAGAARANLLVVPTAAAAQNPAKAASNGVGYFAALGAEASPLMVLDRRDADDEALVGPVDTADVIYFTGGDPAHLLDVLKGSALLRKMRQALDRGAVVAGSSAGAMVMGSWMRFREWREALGIVPGVVTLPHHERSDPDSVVKELAQSGRADAVVLGVDSRTGCLGGPEEWTVAGAGAVTVYQAGRWQRYSSGDRFSLA